MVAGCLLLYLLYINIPSSPQRAAATRAPMTIPAIAPPPNPPPPPSRLHGDPSHLGPPSHGRISMIMQSPPASAYHDSSAYNAKQGGGSSSSSSRSAAVPAAEREFQRPGPPSRQTSYTGSSQERERESSWESRSRAVERRPESPPLHRPDGRMSPPDSARMDES